jgi:DNA-binding Lrp family transcriptional regulator
MDDLDRRLIAELRMNGRASVPKLANALGVARGTAQARLDRLVENGTIKGFTIRLRDGQGENQIRGIILIEIGGRNVKAIVAAVKKEAGFVALHNTTGKWDMIGEFEVPDMASLSRIASNVRAIDGVDKSETYLLLAPA